MKIHSWLCNLASVLLLASLAACGGSGDGGATVPLPVSGGGTPPPAQLGVAFTVVDTLGQPLAGVTVQRKETLEEVTTDATGQAIFRAQRAGRAVWRQYKEGFVSNLQADFSLAHTPFARSVVMMHREAAVFLADANAGGTVIGKDGLTLTLAPNALQVPGGGAVEIWLTPIDSAQKDIAATPPHPEFQSTPWDLAERVLLSYGMAELVVRKSGTAAPANLLEPATIEIPLYASQHPDGRSLAVGDRIVVAALDRVSHLYFDSLWRLIAEGEVIAVAASPTGYALRTTLPSSDGAGGLLQLNSHFVAIALKK